MAPGNHLYSLLKGWQLLLLAYNQNIISVFKIYDKITICLFSSQLFSSLLFPPIVDILLHFHEKRGAWELADCQHLLQSPVGVCFKHAMFD